MRVVALILTALACGRLPVMAQEAAPSESGALTLSLKAAVAKALEVNPSLAAVREELPAALARLRMARSEGQLTASGSVFLSTGTMPNILSSPDAVSPRMLMAEPDTPRADGSLMFAYPVVTGGRVGARVKAAGARVKATQADIDTEVLSVAYEVRKAYWQVLLNQEIAKVQEENLAEQRERLRVDQLSYDAGKVPLYYVLRDKAEVAQADQNLTNARRDVAIALIDLRVAIGLTPGGALGLSDQLAYNPAAAAADEEAQVKAALDGRPEARSLRSALLAAKRDVGARKSTYQPQVDGMLILEGETTSGDAQAGYLAGVVASLPVLDGGSRGAAVREGLAMVRKTEKELAALGLQIERDVRTALLQVKAANQNVRTAMEAVAAAEEDHRVALARYQAGKAINLEPISALAALVAARTNLAQALYEYNVAVDAAAKAAGALPPTE
jgi:outer membrane protein